MLHASGIRRSEPPVFVGLESSVAGRGSIIIMSVPTLFGPILFRS